MRVDAAMARVIGAANPDAPTWQAEALNALSTAAIAGTAATDTDTLGRRLRPDLATIREHFHAAKTGNGDAANAILDACDNIQATIDQHLGPDWTPDLGTAGAALINIAEHRT